MNTAENNPDRKYTHCANCGSLLKNTYVTFEEETLNGTVFFELDGSDNAFCDKDCACDTLRLTKRAN
jgi:NAD-dependent SIR2 family protein deacetylase